MNIKNILTCLVLAVVCFFMSFYSYNSYVAVKSSSLDHAYLIKSTKDDSASNIKALRADLIDRQVPFSEFDYLNKRNPFKKYMKKVVSKKPDKKFVLPSIKKIVEKTSVFVEPEPEEIYLYRGIVVLGDKMKYVVERQRDRKTFFVNKGDRTQDFIVLETSSKEIVISDKNEKIRVLKVIL